MKRLVIGSTAADYYGINLGRRPKDLDSFTDTPDESDGFWHESFNDWLEEGTNRHANLDELYTIKVSHSYWDLRNGSWEKHVADMIKLKKLGARLDQELHDLLYKVWIETHGPKQVNLNMNAADFFNDAVVRLYDHDSIHDSVAYGDKAMYESVLKDNAEVGISMVKVKALPFDDQVKLYREEIYATALERWVIPSNYKISPRLAYGRALKRTLTSLTKGWSAQFIAENFELFSKPDIDYIKHHKSKSHKLIPLEGK